MKPLIATILFCSLMGVSVSCSKDESEDIATEKPRYYVKYIISTQYTDAEGEMRNDKGEVIHFKGNGEYIYGPVEKGFNALMNVTKCNRKTIGQIWVSMYEEPFALKASQETYGNTFQLSYTVE